MFKFSIWHPVRIRFVWNVLTYVTYPYGIFENKILLTFCTYFVWFFTTIFTICTGLVFWFPRKTMSGAKVTWFQSHSWVILNILRQLFYVKNKIKIFRHHPRSTQKFFFSYIFFFFYIIFYEFIRLIWKFLRHSFMKNQFWTFKASLFLVLNLLRWKIIFLSYSYYYYCLTIIISIFFVWCTLLSLSIARVFWILINTIFNKDTLFKIELHVTFGNLSPHENKIKFRMEDENSTIFFIM